MDTPGWPVPGVLPGEIPVVEEPVPAKLSASAWQLVCEYAVLETKTDTLTATTRKNARSEANKRMIRLLDYCGRSPLRDT